MARGESVESNRGILKVVHVVTRPLKGPIWVTRVPHRMDKVLGALVRNVELRVVALTQPDSRTSWEYFWTSFKLRLLFTGEFFHFFL